MDARLMESYVAGQQILNSLKDVDAVIDFLKSSQDAQPCANIGKAVWGDKYVRVENARCSDDYWRNYERRHLIAHLSQMLRHLVKTGYIKYKIIDGTPVEVTHTKYVENEPYSVPREIEAYDAHGNFLGLVNNPKYDNYAAMRASSSGSWKEVTETIIPKIRAYYWVSNE